MRIVFRRDGCPASTRCTALSRDDLAADAIGGISHAVSGLRVCACAGRVASARYRGRGPAGGPRAAARSTAVWERVIDGVLGRSRRARCGWRSLRRRRRRWMRAGRNDPVPALEVGPAVAAAAATSRRPWRSAIPVRGAGRARRSMRDCRGGKPADASQRPRPDPHDIGEPGAPSEPAITRADRARAVAALERSVALATASRRRPVALRPTACGSACGGRSWSPSSASGGSRLGARLLLPDQTVGCRPPRSRGSVRHPGVGCVGGSRRALRPAGDVPVGAATSAGRPGP